MYTRNILKIMWLIRFEFDTHRSIKNFKNELLFKNLSSRVEKMSETKTPVFEVYNYLYHGRAIIESLSKSLVERQVRLLNIPSSDRIKEKINLKTAFYFESSKITFSADLESYDNVCLIKADPYDTWEISYPTSYTCQSIISFDLSAVNGISVRDIMTAFFQEVKTPIDKRFLKGLHGVEKYKKILARIEKGEQLQNFDCYEICESFVLYIDVRKMAIYINIYMDRECYIYRESI